MNILQIKLKFTPCSPDILMYGFQSAISIAKKQSIFFSSHIQTPFNWKRNECIINCQAYFYTQSMKTPDEIIPLKIVHKQNWMFYNVSWCPKPWTPRIYQNCF